MMAVSVKFYQNGRWWDITLPPEAHHNLRFDVDAYCDEFIEKQLAHERNERAIQGKLTLVDKLTILLKRKSK